MINVTFIPFSHRSFFRFSFNFFESIVNIFFLPLPSLSFFYRPLFFLFSLSFFSSCYTTTIFQVKFKVKGSKIMKTGKEGAAIRCKINAEPANHRSNYFLFARELCRFVRIYEIYRVSAKNRHEIARN